MIFYEFSYGELSEHEFFKKNVKKGLTLNPTPWRMGVLEILEWLLQQEKLILKGPDAHSHPQGRLLGNYEHQLEPGAQNHLKGHFLNQKIKVPKFQSTIFFSFFLSAKHEFGFIFANHT